MKLDDPINDHMEATMRDITTPAYRFTPTAAFATTRAGAERRSRQAAAAEASKSSPERSGNLLRAMFSLLTRSSS